MCASCALQQQSTEESESDLFSLPANQPKDEKGSWIHLPLNYAEHEGNLVLSPKVYWETQTTRLPMAVEKLKDKTIEELTSEDAEYYAGPHYRKQIGTRPYLVRAVFWNYTGDFSLYWLNDELHVSYFSLGWMNGEKKLPIIVNLKRPPRAVYTFMGSAL
jgi:hypothetical protein